MFSETAPSHLSQAILTGNKIEKRFYQTHILPIDRERRKIRLNADRHMETFLHVTRKRHETWYRYDKYFRDALKKEKDRHEKHKERCGSSTNPVHQSVPSLITINSLPDRRTKTEQRTNQVLQAAQKLLDRSEATRSQSSLIQSRPSTSLTGSKSFITRTARSSSAYCSASLNVPMTQSIDFDEYTRLMNESLECETYSGFVDHFVKFRPEFREHFAQFHQANQREHAVAKLRSLNQTYAKQRDQRYYNLLTSLTDFRLEQKRKTYKY
ncbi:unnamed protein product [Adineta ricciae]|uniref:Uncharacterized protein n=1 Tax=Adineta ricciae TaxID=249248 RepID=A0A814FUB7_ADIRI|nr:unnamed protein product [Adineta ricciae]CAF1363061.1 unnamed protein product [Adineta ricciae]